MRHARAALAPRAVLGVGAGGLQLQRRDYDLIVLLGLERRLRVGGAERGRRTRGVRLLGIPVFAEGHELGGTRTQQHRRQIDRTQLFEFSELTEGDEHL